MAGPAMSPFACPCEAYPWFGLPLPLVLGKAVGFCILYPEILYPRVANPWNNPVALGRSGRKGLIPLPVCLVPSDLDRGWTWAFGISAISRDGVNLGTVLCRSVWQATSRLLRAGPDAWLPTLPECHRCLATCYASPASELDFAQSSGKVARGSWHLDRAPIDLYRRPALRDSSDSRRVGEPGALFLCLTSLPISSPLS